MGMAASQARYLALVARKSNCEYEGQQINQARLNLSNQTANLFNQMLGLTVPVPPSTQDFTTTQYSYTDGINTSVIDSWKQLSKSDPEYNYVVKTHYFTDVYTGSMKKMSDPQVQITVGAGGIAGISTIENALAAMKAADNEQQVKLKALQAKQKEVDSEIAALRNQAQKNNSYSPINNAIINMVPLAAAVNGLRTGSLSDGATIFDLAKVDYATMSPNAPLDHNGMPITTVPVAPLDHNGNQMNSAPVAPAAYDGTPIPPEGPDPEDATLYPGGTTDPNYIADKQKWDDYKGDLTSWNNYQNDLAAADDSYIDANAILKQLRNMVDLGIINIETVQAQVMAQNPSYWVDSVEDIYTVDVTSKADFTAAQQAILDTYMMCDAPQSNTAGYSRYLITQKTYDDIVAAVPSNTNPVAFSGYQYQGVAGDPFYHNTATSGTSGTPIDSYLYSHDDGYVQRIHTVDDGTTSATITTDRFRDLDLYQDEIAALEATLAPYQLAYDAAHVTYVQAEDYYNSVIKPEYIGNCPLTLLMELTDDQATELKQVVKDLSAQGVDTALLNGEYFDNDGNYLGGVYTFDLNGVTYYTTYTDLCNAYASNELSNNFIDAQYKMPYFNASYINTRIEQECKALLETDGQGRFTTVRFENDSVTYTLNMETITDDAAYKDAMNRYNYESAQYDKMVQDINAKTSIIHQQDQELELRLKQLDTEQNALKTEIDAVQKIVKDNVEASFKTFGG